MQDVNANEDWNTCLDTNGMSLGRCIYHCDNDEACETACVHHFKMKTENCPCEKNCPSGCPCPLYECDDITPTMDPTTPVIETTTATVYEEAVLVLSSTYSDSNITNPPMVIGFDGKYNIIYRGVLH